MDYLLPQSITELGNCLMQLAATLIFVSIVQPIFLAGGLLNLHIHFCTYTSQIVFCNECINVRTRAKLSCVLAIHH